MFGMVKKYREECVEKYNVKPTSKVIASCTLDLDNWKNAFSATGTLGALMVKSIVVAILEDGMLIFDIVPKGKDSKYIQRIFWKNAKKYNLNVEVEKGFFSSTLIITWENEDGKGLKTKAGIGSDSDESFSQSSIDFILKKLS